MYCEFQNCPYRAEHKITLTALEGKIRKEVNLCPVHFLDYEYGFQKSGESVFKQRLKEIDEGRFFKILDALEINEDCFKCYYLNPKITDAGQGYRCRGIPWCMAASLSNEFKSYLFWKLGEITEEQHMANLHSGSFLKI